MAFNLIHNAPTVNIKNKARMVVALLEKIKGDAEEAEEEARQLEEMRAMAEQAPVIEGETAEEEEDEPTSASPAE